MPSPSLPVLSIAGSDPSGGAGIQADLKTLHQHGVYGMSVITLLTVQDTTGVHEVWPVPSDNVSRQLRAVLNDIPPAAIKIGAIGERATVEAIAKELRGRHIPIVLDPILASTSGRPLLSADAIATFVERLLPLATLVTPNLPEASLLTGRRVKDLDGMQAAAKRLVEQGATAALVTGGHLSGQPTDVLLDGDSVRVFRGERIAGRGTHGTGCVLSSSVAANTALGADLGVSVERARRFLREAIRTSPDLGTGNGPTNMLADCPNPNAK